MKHLVATFVLAFTLAVPSAAFGQSKSNQASFSQLAERAKQASEANRLEDARRLYAQALALHPKWADGWWALGTLEYDQDQYAKARSAFSNLVTLQPTNGPANAMLGLCEFDLGQPDQALQHLKKGQKIGLNDDVEFWHVVLFHEGILLQRKGSFEAARETLEQLCSQGGQGDQVATILGMTLLRMTSDKPLESGTEADTVTKVGRADCLAGQKKYEEARSGFEEVVSQNPNFTNIHYAYGLFLLDLRDVPGAVAQFKQEIENNPDHVFARLRIASVLYKDDSAAALPYAEDAVKLNPQIGFGHYLLGLLLLDSDSYARAIPELEQAQKSLPREAKLYLALGSAYSRAGRPQDAARARATFERLNKEGAASSLSGDENGIDGTVQRKMKPEAGANR